MTPAQEVDYVLHDCFLAVGQAIGPTRHVDPHALIWWRTRYRTAFADAMRNGNSWQRDRDRVTAVGRYLGQRALHHAGDSATIDITCAIKASADVESGCRMNAQQESGLHACTNRSI
jgi:hypothetical protein